MNSNLEESSSCDLCNVELGSVQEQLEHDFSLIHHMKLNQRNKKLNHSCSMCKCWVGSIKSYVAHLHGTKHKKALNHRKQLWLKNPPTTQDLSTRCHVVNYGSSQTKTKSSSSSKGHKETQKSKNNSSQNAPGKHHGASWNSQYVPNNNYSYNNYTNQNNRNYIEHEFPRFQSSWNYDSRSNRHQAYQDYRPNSKNSYNNAAPNFIPLEADYCYWGSNNQNANWGQPIYPWNNHHNNNSVNAYFSETQLMHSHNVNNASCNREPGGNTLIQSKGDLPHQVAKKSSTDEGLDKKKRATKVASCNREAGGNTLIQSKGDLPSKVAKKSSTDEVLDKKKRAPKISPKIKKNNRNSIFRTLLQVDTSAAQERGSAKRSSLDSSRETSESRISNQEMYFAERDIKPKVSGKKAVNNSKTTDEKLNRNHTFFLSSDSDSNHKNDEESSSASSEDSCPKQQPPGKKTRSDPYNRALLSRLINFPYNRKQQMQLAKWVHEHSRSKKKLLFPRFNVQFVQPESDKTPDEDVELKKVLSEMMTDLPVATIDALVDVLKEDSDNIPDQEVLDAFLMHQDSDICAPNETDQEDVEEKKPNVDFLLTQLAGREEEEKEKEPAGSETEPNVPLLAATFIKPDPDGPDLSCGLSTTQVHPSQESTATSEPHVPLEEQSPTADPLPHMSNDPSAELPHISNDPPTEVPHISNDPPASLALISNDRPAEHPHTSHNPHGEHASETIVFATSSLNSQPYLNKSPVSVTQFLKANTAELANKQSLPTNVSSVPSKFVVTCESQSNNVMEPANSSQCLDTNRLPLEVPSAISVDDVSLWNTTTECSSTLQGGLPSLKRSSLSTFHSSDYVSNSLVLNEPSRLETVSPREGRPSSLPNLQCRSPSVSASPVHRSSPLILLQDRQDKQETLRSQEVEDSQHNITSDDSSKEKKKKKKKGASAKTQQQPSEAVIPAPKKRVPEEPRDNPMGDPDKELENDNNWKEVMSWFQDPPPGGDSCETDVQSSSDTLKEQAVSNSAAQGLVGQLMTLCKEEERIRDETQKVEQAIEQMQKALEDCKHKKAKLQKEEVELRKQRVKLLEELQGSLSSECNADKPSRSQTAPDTTSEEEPDSFKVKNVHPVTATPAAGAIDEEQKVTYLGTFDSAWDILEQLGLNLTPAPASVLGNNNNVSPPLAVPDSTNTAEKKKKKKSNAKKTLAEKTENGGARGKAKNSKAASPAAAGKETKQAAKKNSRSPGSNRVKNPVDDGANTRSKKRKSGGSVESVERSPVKKQKKKKGSNAAQNASVLNDLLNHCQAKLSKSCFVRLQRTPDKSLDKLIPEVPFQENTLIPKEEDTKPEMSVEETFGPIEAHGSAILDIKVSDGFLYTCSSDRTAKCFEIKNPTNCVQFKGHQLSVSAIQVVTSEDGSRQLFTSSHDGYLRCFNAQTGAVICEQFAGSSVLCMARGWGNLYLGLNNGQVWPYRIKTNKFLDIFEFAHTSISRMAVGSEGVQRLLCVVTYDGTISVRNASSGLLIRLLDRKVRPPCFLQVDGSEIFITTPDRNICVHDLTSGSFLKNISCSSSVTGLSIVKDYIIICSLDGLIRCYNRKSWTLNRVYYGAGKSMTMSLEVVNGWVYSGDRHGFVEAFKSEHTLDATCHFQECGVPFGLWRDLKQHVLSDHMAKLTPGSVSAWTSCPWKDCKHLLSGSTAREKFQKLEVHILDHAKFT